jgi:hypothetical protein
MEEEAGCTFCSLDLDDVADRKAFNDGDIWGEHTYATSNSKEIEEAYGN